MKECVICGEKVSDGDLRCSQGHSLFRHPRTDSYTVDAKEIEEILRQSFVSSPEDEISYLLGETIRILSKDRTPVTKEQVQLLGKNLMQGWSERKHRQQEEAERKRREQEERERKRQEQEVTERKRRQEERERKERQEAQLQLRRQQDLELLRREQSERLHSEFEKEERRREEQEREAQKRWQKVESIVRQQSVGSTEDEILYFVNEISSILNWHDLPITTENIETVVRSLRRNLATRKEQESIERGRRQALVRRVNRTRELVRARELGIASLNSYQATQFLLEHFKHANLQNPGMTKSRVPDMQFNSNEGFWRKVLAGQRIALQWIELTDFNIVDWFPRSPGLFHTPHAREARSNAQRHVVEENGIKFYTPEGKMHMAQGGTGSVRFKPLKIDGEDCWLCTATRDTFCHSGIPLAIPNTIMQKIPADSRRKYNIKGQVKFLPKFLSDDYFYHMSRIPQLYVFVSEIELGSKPGFESAVMITPMVLFRGALETDYENRYVQNRRWEGTNVTYVVCLADDPFELDQAIDWLTGYAERYQGEVITNFDEQRPAFSNAPFSLQNVMSGNIDTHQMQELRIDHADIVCNTIRSIHSEETNMSQINVRLGNGVTIHGDLVVANLIKDSFNKASEETSGELKNLLRELSVAVGKMSENMSRGDAVRVARALNTVVEEASSSEPNREWWQVSVDGLKKAAQNIGDMGKPVLDILGKLVPLLLTMS